MENHDKTNYTTNQVVFECDTVHNVSVKGTSDESIYKNASKKTPTRAPMRTVTLLIIFIFLFLWTLPIFDCANVSSDDKKYCDTPLCKNAEDLLLHSMNVSVDPCDNFYQFACGNWRKENPVPDYLDQINVLDIARKNLQKSLKKFLDTYIQYHDPEPIKDAKVLYRSCMSAETEDQQNVGFNRIRTTLEKLGLNPIPLYNPSKSFYWQRTAVLAKRLLNKDFFLKFYISWDIRNRTRNQMYFAKPTADSPIPFHALHEEPPPMPRAEDDASVSAEEAASSPYLDAFFQYIYKVTQYVYEINGVQLTPAMEAKLGDKITEMMAFTYTFEKINMEYFRDDYIFHTISIDNLQKTVNEISKKENSTTIINWKEYLLHMFIDMPDSKLDFDHTDTEVTVKDVKYLNNVFHLLAKASPEAVELYMWWTVMQMLMPYSKTTLRQFHDEFWHVTHSKDRIPRNIYCVNVVNNAFGVALSYSLIEDTELKENIEKVNEIVANVQSAFEERLRNVDWLDDETHDQLLLKISSMKKNVGFPRWVENRTRLESYYADVTLKDDDFLQNMLNIVQEDSWQMLKRLRARNNINMDMWAGGPLVVNAYYVYQTNTVVVPAGVMYPPFYKYGLAALDYGAIGAAVGHEMTHGFEYIGKNYNANGEMKQVWPNETNVKFDQRSECFVNYYNSLNLSSDFRVDGERTLNENIADNEGLRWAFYAYQNHVRKHGSEPLLSRLKDYTAEQLFFIAFANTHCYSELEEPENTSDVHGPDDVRVIATLANSKEFADTWKCTQGTRMNPQNQKCQLW